MKITAFDRFKPGVTLECAGVDEARRYADEFPLSKAGFLECEFISVDAPLPLEFLFDESVDNRPPLQYHDRG